jgi:hypothetical protein
MGDLAAQSPRRRDNVRCVGQVSGIDHTLRPNVAA